MPAAKNYTALRNRGSRVKTTKAPIMYNMSGSPDELKKSFELALAYALAVGRQVDLAHVCGVTQGAISLWSNGHPPRDCNLPKMIKKLAAFISRRSRKGGA